MYDRVVNPQLLRVFISVEALPYLSFQTAKKILITHKCSTQFKISCVVDCALNAWQTDGLNALQQAMNSDCYLSNVFCCFITLEYVVKLTHMLQQGMLEILRG
jgi:hypothetical protein